jgi:hypothetical protein
MKTRYYILAGILYTIFIGFTASTIQHRVTQEELKSVYEEEYCEVVYEYTGEVYGDEWNELFAIAVENEEERDELQAIIDEGIDKYYEEEFGESRNQSDANAYIDLFLMLTDPINWIFTLMIATFIGGFYLTFYSCKLAIERHFRKEDGKD